jgi:hypothetical protein
MSTPPTSTANPPANRHALTAVEKQRGQLEKLLKDPSKPAFVPTPPQEKTIRPAREMMKNVQGSSAGAGSGEFHVYKASRRREYERIKLLEESSQKARLFNAGGVPFLTFCRKLSMLSLNENGERRKNWPMQKPPKIEPEDRRRRRGPRARRPLGKAVLNLELPGQKRH